MSTSDLTTTATSEADGATRPSAWLERRVRLWQPHHAVTYLFVGLLALGLWHFLRSLQPSVTLYGSTVVWALLLWGLYVLPWVVLIRHHELFAPLSRRTAAVGFLWGAFVATEVMAISSEVAIQSLLSKLVSPELSASWGPALSAAPVEETAKGLGIIVVLLLVRDRLRSPFETMVLGAFVGLGFQVVEDLGYTFGAIDQSYGTDQLADVSQTFFLRGIETGLWSHALLTSIWGAGLGFIVAKEGRRVGVGVLCIVAAMLLHLSWDSPLLASTAGLAFKGLVATLVFVLVFRLAVDRERTWVVGVLQDEVARGTISEDELELLSSRYRRRRLHLRHVRHEHGKAAARAERDFTHAVTALADARYDADGADEPEVQAWRAEVVHRRADRDAALAPA